MHDVLVHQGAFHRPITLGPCWGRGCSPSPGTSRPLKTESCGHLRRREVKGSGMCFLSGGGRGGPMAPEKASFESGATSSSRHVVKRYAGEEDLWEGGASISMGPVWFLSE